MTSKEQTWKALQEPHGSDRHCSNCEYEPLVSDPSLLPQLAKNDPCWDCYMVNGKTNWKYKKPNKKLDKS